jgi:membrane-associated protease RseP (regulator of RpoE activity)
VAVLSYFSVILLHEAGHALFARQLGCRPTHIYLSFIHGVCEFEHPDTMKEHATIAWGGVFAQFAVAIPLMVLYQTTPIGSVSLLAIPVAILGYMSLLVAFMNLAPARGLDGVLAWRLLPILFREFRAEAAARKAAQDVIRRLK